MSYSVYKTHKNNIRETIKMTNNVNYAKKNENLYYKNNCPFF
jgi:hypothetical protein